MRMHRPSSVQVLRPLARRGSADGGRHRAVTHFQEAEALLADDPRFGRPPRYER